MTSFWLVLFILILSNLRPNESGKSLPLCTEQDENVHQLCTFNEEHCPVCPPKSWPKSVTPILDLRGVLDADVDKRTITVFMKIILIWKDHEIFIKNSKTTQWAKNAINLDLCSCCTITSKAKINTFFKFCSLCGIILMNTYYSHFFNVSWWQPLYFS